MGSGIATAILLAGGEVVLKEVDQRFLDAGVQRIRANLDSRLKKGALSQQAYDGILARLKPTLAYSDFSRAQVVIEAVFEDMDLKQKVFAEIEAAAPRDAILATNTSTMDIDKVAA